MVDMKSLEVELQQARKARMEAEAASADVEDMIFEVQHVEQARPKMAFFISGFDDVQVVPPPAS